VVVFAVALAVLMPRARGVEKSSLASFFHVKLAGRAADAARRTGDQRCVMR
jgi:hypothetical protein